MICIGHSHMASVLVAAEAAGAPLRAIVLNDQVPAQFATIDTDGLVFESAKAGLGPETRRLLETERPVCSFVGGSKHISIGLRHQQPFDFVLSEAPGLPLEPDAELVPADAMRDVLRSSSRRYLQTLEQIAEVAGGYVHQFESPPPPAVGPGRFLRYKLWRLSSQLVRERAAELGIRFVESPREAVDPDGFLRAELCRGTQANSAYRALVLEQLRSIGSEERAIARLRS